VGAVVDGRVDAGLAEALAWGAFSFAPASAVFTRVGTLLAERLLYLPSLGFCLALGWALNAAEAAAAAAAKDGFDDGAGAQAPSGGSTDRAPGSASQKPSSPPSLKPPPPPTPPRPPSSPPPVRWMRCACWAGVAALAGRTRGRIPAWRDDWSLFHAILDACPESAKTHNQVTCSPGGASGGGSGWCAR
jgi:hypothetical protein